MTSIKPTSLEFQEAQDLDLQKVASPGIPPRVVGLNDNIDEAAPLHISDAEGGGAESPVRVVTRMSSKRKTPILEIIEGTMNGNQSQERRCAMNGAYKVDCVAASDGGTPNKKPKLEGSKDGGAVEDTPEGVLTRAGSKRKTLAAASLEARMKNVRLNGNQRIVDSGDEAVPDVMGIRVRSKRKAPPTDLIEGMLSDVHLVGSQGCEEAGCDGISADGPCRSKQMKKNIGVGDKEVLPASLVIRRRSNCKTSTAGIIEETLNEEHVDNSKRNIGSGGKEVLPGSLVIRARSKRQTLAARITGETINEEHVDNSKRNVAGSGEKVPPVGKISRTKSSVPETLEHIIAYLKRFQTNVTVSSVKVPPVRKAIRRRFKTKAPAIETVEDMIAHLPRSQKIDIEPISKYTISTRSSTKDKMPPTEKMDAQSGGTEEKSAAVVLRSDSGPGDLTTQFLTKGLKKDAWTSVRKADLELELLEKVEGMFCRICFRTSEQINSYGGYIVATGCGHVTCNKCLGWAVKCNGRCPVCRKKVRRSQFQKLLL